MPTQIFRAGSMGSDIHTDSFLLWGKMTTSGNVTHLRKQGATAGYQVTAGKTLYMTRFRVNQHAAATIGMIKFGYADNDVGLDTTTARTNPVMSLGLDDIALNGYPMWLATGVSSDAPNVDMLHGWGDKAYGFLWPLAAALKFPFVRGQASLLQCTVIVIGIER